MVLDIIFVIVFAGCDEAKLVKRADRGEKADFAGGVAVRDQEKKGSAAGAFDVQAEALVGFFKQQRVGGGGIAKAVTIETMGALGDRIFDHIEEVAVVGGPGGSGHTLGSEREEFTGSQVFDLQGVLAEPGGVGRVGEEVVVVGDFE